LMQADPRLREQDIRIVPFAATNYDGDGEFFVVKAHFPTDSWRGMSSLYERAGRADLSSETMPVKTVRLDSFLAAQCTEDLRLALWIDAEGKAFEVIEGATGLARHIVLLHVEVETSACISAHQKLYPEVKARLDSLGFVQLSTDAPPTQAQFNAVFIRNDLPDAQMRRVRWWLSVARARRAITPLVRRFIPRSLLQRRTFGR
jgi:FkbM family methyltransferase